MPPPRRLPAPLPCSSPQEKNSSGPFSEKEGTTESGRPPSGLGTPCRRWFCSGVREGHPKLHGRDSGWAPRVRTPDRGPLGVRARRREDRLGRAQSAARSPAASPPLVNHLLARVGLRSGRRDPSPQTRRTCARRRTAEQLSVKATRETRTAGAADLSALLGRRSAGIYHHRGRGTRGCCRGHGDSRNPGWARAKNTAASE